MTKRLGLFSINLLLLCCHHAIGTSEISVGTSEMTEDVTVELGGAPTNRRGMDASMASFFGEGPVLHEVRIGC